MKFQIVETTKPISLATIKKLQGNWDFETEMNKLVDKYYPKQKSGDCVPINTSIYLALQELGVKGIKLINGAVELDNLAYDKYEGDTEEEETELEEYELWHFWIALGAKDNIMDYAATVFHTREGEQVYIERYYSGDWDVTGIHEVNEKLKEDVKNLILQFVGKGK